MAMLLVLSCFAGCVQESGSDLKDIQNKGKIVVGITEYAPMDFKDENGNWTGFDAELATLFANELGVEIEFFVIADWGKKFVELETDTPQVFSIWGHSYEMDSASENWMRLEEFFRLISNREDIFYGTNKEVLL